MICTPLAWIGPLAQASALSIGPMEFLILFAVFALLAKGLLTWPDGRVGLTGRSRMSGPLGPSIFEWWAGLPRGTRIIVALVVLASGGVSALCFPSAWLMWGPIATAGAAMLFAA
jgi:hypothetical protein